MIRYEKNKVFIAITLGVLMSIPSFSVIAADIDNKSMEGVM